MRSVYKWKLINGKYAYIDKETAKGYIVDNELTYEEEETIRNNVSKGELSKETNYKKAFNAMSNEIFKETRECLYVYNFYYNISEFEPIEYSNRGPKGDIGPKGDRGLQGPRGPRGRRGPKGKDGSAVEPESLIKTYNAVAYKLSDSMPETPDYMDEENGGSYDFKTLTYTPPTGWEKTSDFKEDVAGKECYITTRIFFDDKDKKEPWSKPYSINGLKGEDGVNNESIYTLVKDNSDGKTPINPTVSEPWANRKRVINPFSGSTKDGSTIVWKDKADSITEEFRTVYRCDRLLYKYELDGFKGSDSERYRLTSEDVILSGTTYSCIELETPVWGDWFGPILHCSFGKNGADGDGVEYVFTVSESINNEPYIPHGSGVNPDICSSISSGSSLYNIISGSSKNILVKGIDKELDNVITDISGLYRDIYNNCYTFKFPQDYDETKKYLYYNEKDILNDEWSGWDNRGRFWTDDPVTLESGSINTVQWVSIRKSSTVSGKRVWKDFSKPSMWNRYVKDGEPGESLQNLGYYESLEELIDAMNTDDPKKWTLVLNDEEHTIHTLKAGDSVYIGHSIYIFKGPQYDSNKPDPEHSWDGPLEIEGKSSYLHIKYAIDISKLEENDPETFGWTDSEYDKIPDQTKDYGQKDHNNGDVWDVEIDGKIYKIAKINDEIYYYTSVGESTVNAKYVGMYADDNKEDSVLPKRYKWSKFKGEDGGDLEYIFTLGNDMSNPPEIPGYNDRVFNKDIIVSGSSLGKPIVSGYTYEEYKNLDDFIPVGWVDNAQTADSDNRFCWMCSRKKIEGVWTEFKGDIDGKPILFSNFADSSTPVNGLNSPVIYPVGDWDEKTWYTRTSTTAPYVRYTDSDGNVKYYILTGSKTKDYPQYVIGLGEEYVPEEDRKKGGEYEIRPENSEYWTEMEGFRALQTELIIADNGKVGSAVFNGKFMFSNCGVNYNGNTSYDTQYFYKISPYFDLSYSFYLSREGGLSEEDFKKSKEIQFLQEQDNYNKEITYNDFMTLYCYYKYQLDKEGGDVLGTIYYKIVNSIYTDIKISDIPVVPGFDNVKGVYDEETFIKLISGTGSEKLENGLYFIIDKGIYDYKGENNGITDTHILYFWDTAIGKDNINVFFPNWCVDLYYGNMWNNHGLIKIKDNKFLISSNNGTKLFHINDNGGLEIKGEAYSINGYIDDINTFLQYFTPATYSGLNEDIRNNVFYAINSGNIFNYDPNYSLDNVYTESAPIVVNGNAYGLYENIFYQTGKTNYPYVYSFDVRYIGNNVTINYLPNNIGGKDTGDNICKHMFILPQFGYMHDQSDDDYIVRTPSKINTGKLHTVTYDELKRLVGKSITLTNNTNSDILISHSPFIVEEGEAKNVEDISSASNKIMSLNAKEGSSFGFVNSDINVSGVVWSDTSIVVYNDHDEGRTLIRIDKYAKNFRKCKLKFENGIPMVYVNNNEWENIKDYKSKEITLLKSGCSTEFTLTEIALPNRDKKTLYWKRGEFYCAINSNTINCNFNVNIDL